MASRNGAAAVKRILATKTSLLKVPLTEAELREVAEQTYRVEGDLRTFYGHKKDVTSELKAKEEKLDAELARLGRLGRDKHEYRPTPVRVEADYRVGKVFEIREDTGEVVAERPVNEQDKQTTLFGAAPRATAEKLQAAPAEKLTWHKAGDNDVADVAGGIYCVEPPFGTSGDFTALWTPEKGASKRIGIFFTKENAKEACNAHQVERQADELLKNAGAGELAKKELAGPAERFRKGRR
jgi:hypothetical protein